MIHGQFQERKIPFQMLLRFRVIDLPGHYEKLPRRRPFATAASRRRVSLCAGPHHHTANTESFVRDRSRRIPMSPALQRPHVLIVTDDRDLSDFLGEGLVYAGFWTSTIASAIQALEVFRLRSFDVMVLDAALGGIGAIELLRRLRGRSDRAIATERTDIPILVIAASEVEFDSLEDRLVGADHVIVAPIELEDLAAELGRLVTDWRAAHPERQWADDAALGPA
jgi:CheY-like chemotaxis protein